MSKWSFDFLGLGEWLLNKRWWWISLASLSVLAFEFAEYRPLEEGVTIYFFFEILFYGIVFPLSTGLALSWLAKSRAELVWTVYHQNLIPNLGLQLHNTHTYDELADVFLQFVRVVIPVGGVTLYRCEQNSNTHNIILNWFSDSSPPLSDPIFACKAETCPLSIVGNSGRVAATSQICRDPNLNASSRNSHYYCSPYLFSNLLVAGSRLYFPSMDRPSPEHVRLLREIAPAIASTFRRIQLESLMKRQDDKIFTEHQRIARDVHDTLGHSLAYLRLRLDQINMEFDHTEADTLHKEVESLQDVAKEAYDQMREVLGVLSINSNINLNDMLTNYTDKISQRANFRYDIRQHGNPRALTPIIQRNIFYIYQEILTNIEKHAHARLININVIWETTHLTIEVQDDGLGFDTTLPIQNGHFGLKNIQERASEGNAQFTISSQIGEGTRIILQVPYEVDL